MILIPVLIGLYLIYAVGYFKLVRRNLPEVTDSYPYIVGFMALLWPLSLTFTFVRAAIR